MNNFFSCVLENQNVFEEITNAIILVDHEGRVKNINERAIQLLNIPIEQAIDKPILEVYAESKLMDTFKTLTVDHDVSIVINGRHCITSRIPVFEGGKPVGAIAIFDDVTKYEALNEKLKADQSEMVILKSILELAYDGILVVDLNGNITMISNAYKRFLGLEDDEVIGKHVTQVIPNTRMHIVAKTGVPEINDFQEIRGDYMVATRIPYYVDGKQAGAIGKVIFRNVSELHNINKKYTKIEQELRNLRSEISSIHKAKYTFEQIITSNDQMNKLKHQAKKIAYTKSNVLIQGESGTGKELFAHAIHQESNRHDMPFISVNCAAIPEQLLESELFGYEKGAFTGADKNGRIGKFELADLGTIFLDEIGDMPLQMQAKILRVLQEGEVERVGSNRPKQIDVRVIAATNRNLLEMVEAKQFREDLYYRLNVINLKIPPLRDRKEDVMLLSKHFIDQLNQQDHGKVRGISEKAQFLLSHYQWQGNIRELRNIIERAYNIMEGDDFIQPYHLPAFMKTTELDYTGEPLKHMMEIYEKKLLLERLIYFKGNKTKTAGDLGISRMALHTKLEKYDLR
ncbi:sigma 54-interacting transcriptional regulator [Fusibacter ferrireducens]|uniref:Sigma 54-interacting transcriptional regulator n=1 Tax=Fusibacter ferrireducens TaxID=2785058 RepID=A0ABR9ZTH4_9FIRM|nr:sigma 54-interacting transcriptional regulator [Fusibacter ferrireducens]MBF4693651.1 sigma 54-interacting transcriptional regulator [Fusibacter ferrireducens]